MKKVISRSLISLGIILGLLFIISFTFFIKMQSEISQMKPLPTKNIVDGIYAINNSYVNFYLIQRDNQLIAIDAGTDSNKTSLEMKKLNLNPEKVVAVFLTHTDSDHVAALRIFKNAKIYISNDEQQMVDGHTHRQLFFNNSLKYPHQILIDNSITKLFNTTIKAIWTPGHTPGSMSYLVDGQYLFTGDTLSLHNGKVAIFNPFFNMNSEAEKQSIHNLANCSTVKYIFTAHYGYTDNPQKAFQDE